MYLEDSRGDDGRPCGVDLPKSCRNEQDDANDQKRNSGRASPYAPFTQDHSKVSNTAMGGQFSGSTHNWSRFD